MPSSAWIIVPTVRRGGDRVGILLGLLAALLKLRTGAGEMSAEIKGYNYK